MSEMIMEFVPHSRQNSIFPKLILSKTGDLYKIWGKVISFLCWSLSQPHFIPVQKRIIKQKAWMWGLDHRVMQSQGLIQSSFENLQRWRFHSLSGQHGPVLGYPWIELFFPNIYLDFLCCNLRPLPLVTPFSFPPLSLLWWKIKTKKICHWVEKTSCQHFGGIISNWAQQVSMLHGQKTSHHNVW